MVPYGTQAWGNLSNNPYAMQQSQYQQAQQYVSPVQPTVVTAWNSVKVDGRTEAMNRFLMHYPANMLMPGFISDPLFDINGRQFHTLSVEPDGRRNLETWDYFPHKDSEAVIVDGVRFESQTEFDNFAAKVKAVIAASSQTGVTNGVHATVPVSTATPSPTAVQPAVVHDAGQNQHAQELSGGQLAGRDGAALQV